MGRSLRRGCFQQPARGGATRREEGEWAFSAVGGARAGVAVAGVASARARARRVGCRPLLLRRRRQRGLLQQPHVRKPDGRSRIAVAFLTRSAAASRPARGTRKVASFPQSTSCGAPLKPRSAPPSVPPWLCLRPMPPVVCWPIFCAPGASWKRTWNQRCELKISEPRRKSERCT